MSIDKLAHSVVHMVLSRPPAERAAMVERETGHDRQLRDAVRSLLARHDSATLAPPTTSIDPAPPASSDPPPSDRDAAPGPPSKIGSYQILSILGEGGMGVVYLAQQESPRRRIALKVIRAGYMSPRLLRRFEHESQILGRLQHPGIAQVFEAGTAQVGGVGSGLQPFFAMEYIDGAPLTTYAARHGLNLRQRLTLFAAVCQAVEHAHQKGVIHRDLKPVNILVDKAGQPKILDFGVARATDADMGAATLNTDFGQLVGTVPYMSPEQISGDPANIDTRCDVYTLGVILYELLAGRLPHAVHDKTIAEAARVIAEHAPPSLGSLDRALRGDPQTIVGKALEKDKARRYQSAADLAADLDRYLRDEPIAARPATTGYQLRMFAKRNNALVGGVAAALVILLGGVIATSYQAAAATAGQKLAEERRLIAERAEAEAKAQAATAKAINEVLSGMLSSIDPEQAMGREPTVREVLERAEAGLAGRFDEMPRVEAELRSTLGQTFHSLARYDDAEKQWRRVIAINESALGADHIQTINAHRNLAVLLADRGRFDEAEDLLKPAVEALARTRGSTDGESAVARSELARVIHETGRSAEAEALFRAAQVDATAAFGPDDKRVITILHNLGSALKSQNKLDEAADLFKETLERRERTVGPEHPQTLYALNSFAAVNERLGKLDEAAVMMRRVIEARTRIMGPDHPTTITSLGNLAVLLTNQKKVAEAEPLARRALEAWTATLGESHPKTMTGMGNVAYICEELGKLDEAEAMYRRAIAARLRASAGKDPESWSPMNNLAMLLQTRGNLPAAEAQFRDLMALVDANLPADHFLGAIYRNNFGACLSDTGKLDEAETALKPSYDVILARFGPDHPRGKRAAERLATLYDRRGDPAAAARVRAQPAASKP